jgi:transposase
VSPFYIIELTEEPEFESFAAGVRKDKAAVLAGLTLPWSNGTLEGHVNRLKLIKRSMYGRAKLHYQIMQDAFIG